MTTCFVRIWYGERTTNHWSNMPGWLDYRVINPFAFPQILNLKRFRGGSNIDEYWIIIYQGEMGSIITVKYINIFFEIRPHLQTHLRMRFSVPHHRGHRKVWFVALARVLSSLFRAGVCIFLQHRGWDHCEDSARFFTQCQSQTHIVLVDQLRGFAEYNVQFSRWQIHYLGNRLKMIKGMCFHFLAVPSANPAFSGVIN